MISIENVPDPAAVDVFEQSLILPVPGPNSDTVLLEERDGPNISQFSARAVRLDLNGSLVAKASDIKVGVFITDARVALACSRYQKGGGWYGGLTAMVLFNAVSKARAAYKRRGKMLVGQVRYPWIQQVGSTSKAGFGSEERLVLDARGADGGNYRLTLVLPKSIDGALVAASVANRAAAYRLACDPSIDPAAAERLRQLVATGPLPSAGKNTIAFHQFPLPHPIEPGSARLTPGRTAGAGAGFIPLPPPPPAAVSFDAPVAMTAIPAAPPPPPPPPPFAPAPVVSPGAPTPTAPKPPANPGPPGTSRLKGKLVDRS